MISVGYLIGLLQAMLPTQWKSNIFAFFCGLVYYVFKVVNAYDSVPIDLYMVVSLSLFYYCSSAYVLHQKNRSLYKSLLQNTKLNKEMRRLFEIFPEGVIIRNSADSQNSSPRSKKFDEHGLPSILFTNHKFELDI